MTKEQFYEKWQPNGFYQHNPIEFMTDLDSVIKDEKSHQAAVSGSLLDKCEQGWDNKTYCSMQSLGKCKLCKSNDR